MQAARDLSAMAGVKFGTLPYGELPEGIAPEVCTATSPELRAVWEGVYEALCDDMNTPVALAQIFEAVRIINSAKAGSVKLSAEDLATLAQIFSDIVFGVLGLVDEESAEGATGAVVGGLMQMVLEERAKAREAKDWAMSDHIRDSLKALGITVKDTKDGAEWTLE